MSQFPQDVQKFAVRFVLMQRRRHLADYDPHAEFRRSEVIEDIDDAAVAIHDYRATNAGDRRAFAIYVLLPLRSP